MSATTAPPKDPPAVTKSSGDTGSGGVQRAAMTVVAFTLLSRIIGMVRDMVIAYQFPVGAHTDAYVAAFKIPDLMTYLIAGGALSSTFIPVFSEYIANKNERGAWKTFSVVATVTFIVAALFVVVAEIFAPQLVLLMNPGYRGHPDQIAITAHLTRIVVPAQIFFMLGGLMMGTLNARKQFLIPALGPSIYNLGIIAGAIVAPSLGLGISGLMWGALAGAFIGNFVLQAISVRRVGARYKPSLAVLYPGAVKVWKMMLPILLGVSLPNVDQIINSYFASELSYGAQTAMQYANRLMLIPIGIFAQAMGIAILPTMAAQAAAKNRKALRATINNGLRTILFLTLPASALFFVLAAPIITLLFQHGQFTAEATTLTAEPLRFYSIGIFAWSAQAVLTRAFYSIQDSRTPVISGTINTGVFIFLNWLVIQMNGGVAGLALATSIVATIHMIVLLIVLSKRLRGLGRRELIISVARTLTATAALAVTAWALRLGVDALFMVVRVPASLHAAVALVLPGGVGLAAFYFIARLLKMPELQAGIDMVKRRKRG
ncbi:lipid II flippase MurJ [Capsulimonas corticalis]|uniref:Probable lipid II flippase MurJ n=1 Tax=Capsulimonas corticalis TaxID=2219043 RepID=A0A402CR67_9BACT|nr:murein biosynthesis integral membrane protein MurJ [Capsulimonas corticalis]BDI34483.1 lipid II flippase MurJ [Capsulimonas corticalis]